MRTLDFWPQLEIKTCWTVMAEESEMSGIKPESPGFNRWLFLSGSAQLKTGGSIPNDTFLYCHFITSNMHIFMRSLVKTCSYDGYYMCVLDVNLFTPHKCIPPTCM